VLELNAKMIVDYEYLGYAIRIMTSDAGLYNACRKNYAISFRILSAKEMIRRKIDVTVSLTIKKKPSGIGVGYKKIGEVSGKLGVHRCYKKGNGLLYLHGKSSLEGNIKTGRFKAFLGSKKDSMPIFLRALSLFMQSRGMFVLHCAVVAKGKNVFLLAGESGAGKTTLGINLIRKDFFYLADDSCLLMPGKGPRVGAFMLPNDPAPKFKVISNYLLKSKGLPEDIIGTCRKKHFPNFIVFPKISGFKKSKLVQVSANEAVIRLIQLSQLMWLEDKAQLQCHIRAIKRLAKQCRCFKLLAGRDRKEAAQLVANIL